MYIAKNVTPAVAKRQRIERAIVRRVVRDLLAAGYTLDVDDGGDGVGLEDATSYKPVIDALMNTDEDFLKFKRRLVGLEWQTGWVRFVYGNDGWDVICDYSANPHTEALLDGALKLAEKLEGRQ